MEQKRKFSKNEIRYELFGYFHRGLWTRVKHLFLFVLFAVISWPLLYRMLWALGADQERARVFLQNLKDFKMILSIAVVAVLSLIALIFALVVLGENLFPLIDFFLCSVCETEPLKEIRKPCDGKNRTAPNGRACNVRLWTRDSGNRRRRLVVAGGVTLEEGKRYAYLRLSRIVLQKREKTK